MEALARRHLAERFKAPLTIGYREFCDPQIAPPLLQNKCTCDNTTNSQSCNFGNCENSTDICASIETGKKFNGTSGLLLEVTSVVKCTASAGATSQCFQPHMLTLTISPDDTMTYYQDSGCVLAKEMAGGSFEKCNVCRACADSNGNTGFEIDCSNVGSIATNGCRIVHDDGRVEDIGSSQGTTPTGGSPTTSTPTTSAGGLERACPIWLATLPLFLPLFTSF